VATSRKRRILRRILVFLVVSTVVVQGLFWWFVRLPKPDVEVPDVGIPVAEGDRVTLGDAFLERRDGYWLMLHRGDAVTIGARHAAMGEFLIQRVEDALFGSFAEEVPLLMRPVIPTYLMWHYRRMPWQLPPEQLEELWGFSATYADRHAFPLSAYRRGMYYHAIHDITQELIGNPWVDPTITGACTSFAASGNGTDDGHLIVGRNFDFETFPLFDTDKVVHIHAREGAIPVISVSWAAMAGVTTGMNADGIWISFNSARSEGKNREGPPVSLWIRSILEQARSIDDVERLLRADSPMVTDIYLVADGKTGEAVVIERGQTRMDVRGMRDGRIVAANHLLTPEFEGDTGDDWLRRNSSTISRHLRTEELVAEGSIDPMRAQAILRDRRGPGGIELPPGNRNAIDALIATHSVVADVTDRVLWVSTAPHTQGAYRAVDLLAELEAAGIDADAWRAGLPRHARPWEEQIGELGPDGEIGFAAPPPGDLPHDRFFGSGEFEVLLQHRSFLDDSERYLADERFELARDMADRAEATLPGTPDAAWARGEACRLMEDEACARAAWVDYLQRFPPLDLHHTRVLQWLSEHGGIPEVDRPDGMPVELRLD